MHCLFPDELDEDCFPDPFHEVVEEEEPFQIVNLTEPGHRVQTVLDIQGVPLQQLPTLQRSQLLQISGCVLQLFLQGPQLAGHLQLQQLSI